MTQTLMILLFVGAGFDLLGGLALTAIGLLYPLIAAFEPPRADDPPAWAMFMVLAGMGTGWLCFGATKLYAGWLVKRGEGWGAAMVANILTLVMGICLCNMIHLVLGIAGLVVQNNQKVRAELEGWADPIG
ncbi:MAG: hypothetical protein H6742_03235 [Alphaproteobacteria bacterium]|nr:hypothetical protein [Alphaproteobacteria bacterium]